MKTSASSLEMFTIDLIILCKKQTQLLLEGFHGLIHCAFFRLTPFPLWHFPVIKRNHSSKIFSLEMKIHTWHTFNLDLLKYILNF